MHCPLVFQIQKLLGKRKAELFGKDVLDAINSCLSKNPDALAVSGDWVSPKDATLVDSQKAAKRKVIPKATSNSYSTKRSKQDNSGKSKETTEKSKQATSEACICIQDSGSEDADFC